MNTQSTGYKAPSWLTQALDWIKGIFITHPLVTASTVTPPPSFTTDLSAIPVFMQGLYPNCVEESITLYKKWLDYKKTGIVPDLSPFYLFFTSVPSENGTSLKTALQSAYDNGIAERKYFPDPDTTVAYNGVPIVPSAEANANALTHKIGAYMSTTDVSSLNLEALIAQFGLVIVGMQIDEKWWTPSWDYPTMMPLTPPASNSTTVSDHCDILYGYNGQIYSLRNSWSSAWGMGGNGTISPEYISAIYEVGVISS